MSKFPYPPQQSDYENEEDYIPEEGYEGEEYLDDQNYEQPFPQMQPQQSPNFSMAQMQAMQQQMQPQQPQKPYNPYYDGIRSAIAEARESFNSSREQKDRALRKSILSFGNSIGGMERERGFKNNLLAAGRALAPAIEAYDETEAASENSNQALADKLLQAKWSEENRALSERDKMLSQLGAQQDREETARYHRALEGYQAARNASLIDNFKRDTAIQTAADSSDSDLSKILDDAQRLIATQKDATQRGVISRFSPDKLAEAIGRNEAQARIDTMGDILKGKLFNKFKYSNQAEFEHVPTISSAKSPEENLAVIDQIRKSLGGSDDSSLIDNSGNQQGVLMESPDGQRAIIAIESVPAMEAKGNRVVQ